MIKHYIDEKQLIMIISSIDFHQCNIAVNEHRKFNQQKTLFPALTNSIDQNGFK